MGACKKSLQGQRLVSVPLCFGDVLWDSYTRQSSHDHCKGSLGLTITEDRGQTSSAKPKT
eukprot:3451742-Amphidinium_carterae.2